MDLIKTDTRNGKKVGLFNSYIFKRIEMNKNFLGIITGQTGSGKSWSALSLGETLDSDFDINNVCFSQKEFMDLVNGKTKQLKKGSVLVFDEMQVTMSHLTYQSLQAQLLNYVLQTFRYRNFILLMTSPHFSFINASARKLFHSRMETVKIDFKNNKTHLKPFLLQVNQDDGSVYRKYLRIWTKETGVVPLKRLKLDKPSPDLIKAYEEKRKQFARDLNEKIAKQLEDIDQKAQPKQLTLKQEQITDCLLYTSPSPRDRS